LTATGIDRLARSAFNLLFRLNEAAQQMVTPAGNKIVAPVSKLKLPEVFLLTAQSMLPLVLMAMALPPAAPKPSSALLATVKFLCISRPLPLDCARTIRPLPEL
jgi:hypothetical protein